MTVAIIKYNNSLINRYLNTPLRKEGTFEIFSGYILA